MIMKYNAKSLHSIALKYIKRRVYCTLCLQRRHCIWDCFCVHPSQEKAITHRSWQYKADDMIGRESKNLSLGRLVGKLPSLYRGCPYCLIRFYHSSIPGENCMAEAYFPAWIWPSHMQELSRELRFIAQTFHMFGVPLRSKSMMCTGQVDNCITEWEAHTYVSSFSFIYCRYAYWARAA